MNEKEPEKPKPSNSGAILKICLLIVYIIILFFIYDFFIKSGTNLIIGLLLIIFSLLIFIGPIFQIHAKTKKYYNQLFPDRNERLKKKAEKRREEEKRRQDFVFYKKKIVHPIDLDYKYQKSIIRKCYNCGITVPQFVKKCPNCGTPLD